MDTLITFLCLCPYATLSLEVKECDFIVLLLPVMFMNCFSV